MINKTLTLITGLLRVLAALWLAFMGGIASLMLYNEIFNPEWGRQAKEQFPDAPEWYILIIVAIAALACFYISYRLIRPRKMDQDKNISANAQRG
ncbi:hypothetical protein ACFL4R_00265 [Nitrospirota bacterium]